MNKIRLRLPAFTLVEVVLAIGVVAFALLAIFGLFSSSLQSERQTADQIEALNATKALPAFLQTVHVPPQGQGFATVYSMVQNPTPIASPPPIYAYSVPAAVGTGNGPGQSVILLASDPALTATSGTTAAAARQGRLFGVYLTVSPNFPVGSVAYPTGANLPASPSPSLSPSPATGYLEGGLAVQAKVYAVPQINLAPPSAASPVLTYDLMVQH
jgi:hypothetical protein